MPKSKPKGKGILYVKVSSMADLARYAYNFDFSSKSLILNKTGNGSRLMVLGECVKEAVIAYYINVDAPHKFIRYAFPASAGEQESARFAESAEGSEKDYINIFEADLGAFKELKGVGKNDVLQIRVGSVEDLMHAAIKKAIKEESFACLYAFEKEGKRFVCGFDLIEELADDRKTFYYAVAKDKKRGGFAKYSYATNTFEFAEAVGEHSYIYIKIINLAEPLPFFKMPD